MRFFISTVLIIILGCSLLNGGCDGEESPQQPEREAVTTSIAEIAPESELEPSLGSEQVSETEPEITQQPELERTLADPISINTGYISGTLTIDDSGKDIRIYRGIPYAAPPVGDLRWKPPQPVEPWEGIRKCTRFSMEPPQGLFRVDINPQSEDCLYLNVLTPAKMTGDRLPVMVHFHGGGLSWNCGNYEHINSPALPSRGVVLVTVNSRLGVFGLLAHPLLSEESPQGVSGNYLFLDLIATLQWVQDNIAAFGGDPANVTIFGGSGGGFKVIDLMASPLAEGLFHRAIIQSGTLPHGTSLEETESIGEELFERLGIDEEDDPLAAARALEWEEVRNAAEELVQKHPEIYDLTVDGWFMPDLPVEIFKAGKQYPVPCIMGLVMGEAEMRDQNLPFSDMLPYCTNYLSGTEKAGVRGYAYIFDQIPGIWKEEDVPSWHGIDGQYLFGTLGWWDWSNMAEVFGIKDPDPKVDEKDWVVSQLMMEMWTAFARTGDPNIEGMVTWPVYTTDKEDYLYIVYPLEVRSGFSEIYSN